MFNLKLIFIVFIVFIINLPSEASKLKVMKCEKQLSLDDLFEIELSLSGFDDVTHYINGNEFLFDNRKVNYGAFYDSCLSKHFFDFNFSTLDSKKLHKLFRLVYKVHFYYNNTDLTKAMNSIISEKIKRSENVTNLIFSLRKSYLRSRDFDRLNELDHDYENIINPSFLPEFKDFSTSSRTYMELVREKEVVRKNFTFPDGGFVIIVSSPLCSPSNRFFNWLEDNKKVKNLLVSKSLLLTPSDSSLYLKDIINFNNKHRPIIMNYSFNENEWPDISLWDTPTFYFFENGKIKSQLIGWPPKGNSDKFIHELKKINLYMN